jgi:hypothetical protein
MTPKEKAEELVLKYLRLQEEGSSNWFHKILAKQCALIAVNEILDVDCFDMSEEHFDNHIEYWQEVKQEIEKL